MNKRRFFRFKSIHTSIAVAFSCLIIGTTLILSYNTYRQSSDSVTENSVQYTNELINQVGTTIETYIDNMKSISSLLYNNGQIRQYLTMADPHSEVGQSLVNAIESSLQVIVQSRNDISAILFIGSNGAVISDREQSALKSYPELIAQDWYTKAKNDATYISSSEVEHVYRNEYPWVISMSQQFRGHDRFDKTGVLLIDLNYTIINDLCSHIQLGKRGYVFIVNSEGDLVYHPQQQIIHTNLKSEPIEAILASGDGQLSLKENDHEKILSIRTTNFGWKIVGVTYPEELVGNKKKMQLSTVLWGSVCLIIALGISIVLSFTLSRPIKKLEANMKQVEQGNFDIRADITQADEIGKLARSFNVMLVKIKDLMKQIVHEEALLRTSEIKALQSQINPHFLYNTLESIIWMAETNKMREVVKMTMALSKMLRYSIGKGEQEVSVSMEMEHLANYLTVQSMRYTNKFSYAIEVEPELQGCRMLRIMLQPLVENAIYHGIRRMEERGHIRIEGRLVDGVIQITVSDNGLGMDKAKLQGLLGPGPGQESSKDQGLGVWNVHHRIQLFYGTAYGLSFESEPEEGTTVTLRIPCSELEVKDE
ncbi:MULTISPECIES: sensor histidine kinase [Paenibacillus]|uniref:histidine kinase n=1 Tax=Paenibacillus violae TaxID=3077234 RepID=A0ABU3RED5_9BACL|nr:MULTISPECIES: sensor histidine kinase [Paenibacillus]MDU0202458.1 sensor histidine kinase [Paenibacillus sp. PFR10]MEC0266297.1 sensor histidine kinase [Paenibacillus anseongense]